MSGKLITAAAAAILLGSTAIASAQTVVSPYPYDYWGSGYNYYAPGVGVTFGAAPYGYYGYAPRYYNYAPGYGTWGYNGWNGWYNWR
jgi:hypothetical protein